MYKHLGIFLLQFSLIFCLPLDDDTSNEIKDNGPDLSYLGETVFGKPSEETGKILSDWDESSEINPEELGPYAEGDILFLDNGRNGLIAITSIWEGAEIPYEIEPGFNPLHKMIIKKAMDQYHENTCIKFRPRTPSDQDYIAIESSPTGCWSSVGKTGGRQVVNLQNKCLARVGTVIHELMHAVGFVHEQNRYDRDDFVDIVHDNIIPGKEKNFMKTTKDETTSFGVPYDYDSVLHYSETAFSRNGMATIVARGPGGRMGQRDGFSRYDIQKINRMYGCRR